MTRKKNTTEIVSFDDNYSCFHHRDDTYRSHHRLMHSVFPDRSEMVSGSSDVDSFHCCNNDRQCCPYYPHYFSYNLYLDHNHDRLRLMEMNCLYFFLGCFGSYLLDHGIDQRNSHHQKNVGRDTYHDAMDIYR